MFISFEDISCTFLGRFLKICPLHQFREQCYRKMHCIHTYTKSVSDYTEYHNTLIIIESLLKYMNTVQFLLTLFFYHSWRHQRVPIELKF